MQPDRSAAPKRAIIYSRNSQPKQTGNTWSIQRQIDYCLVYCLEHGFILAEDQIYCEAREGTDSIEQLEATEKHRVKKNMTANALYDQSTDRAERAANREERKGA